MGKVIAFQPRKSAGSMRRVGQERDAEIIFFPGVRYERMDDARADARKRSGPASCGASPNGGKRGRRIPA
jgi:hypothetical protein